MPTIIDLGQKVKAKYPEYTDMSDEEVGRRVKAKYPEYSDFEDIKTTEPRLTVVEELQKKAEWAKPVPTAGRIAKFGYGLSQVPVALATTGMRFGETLGTALASQLYKGKIGQYNKNLIDSGSKMVELAMKTDDIVKKKQLLDNARQSFEMAGENWESILPSIKKTTSQILGEAGGVLLDALTIGTYGRAKAIPSIISPLFKKPTTLWQKVKTGLGATAIGAGTGYGYDVTGKLQTEEEKPFAPGLATVIGTVIPPAIFGAKKTATGIKSLYQAIKPSFSEAITRGIKPYFGGTFSAARRNSYMNDAKKAINTITEYKPKLTNEEGISEIRNPQTRAELLDAIGQTKQKVYNEYHNLATNAGKTVGFEVEEIVSKLKQASGDLRYPPKIREYAKSLVNEIKELKGASPEIIEARIQDLNNSLSGFYEGRVSKATAQIDASVANMMREQLDRTIESAGEGYQALRNRYAALKTIERDVARQVNVELRRNKVSLIDFTDIFTGGDLISGILTSNPMLIARGLSGKVLKEYLKHLNNPNRYIRILFDEAEKTLSKVSPEIKTGIRPLTELMGGIAGIEPELDEQGRPIGVKFSPEKAALGIAGMTAVKRGKTAFAKLPFQGFKDLTTKFLDYAKGKTTLSRQEILDFAKRPELKKGEADLLKRLGTEVKENKISAQEFADSMKMELLELKPVKVKDPQYKYVTVDATARRGGADIPMAKNYEEVVFESPITTNGSSHFPNSKNYFAHARGDEVVEGGKKIWREQEIQSDLLQKEGLAAQRTQLGQLPRSKREIEQFINMEKSRNYPDQATIQRLENELKDINKTNKDIQVRFAERGKEIDKLEPFTNDRFGERIMRERIKEKASKGYSKYRLPTGETIGKIEGFSTNEFLINRTGRVTRNVNDLKVGMEITDANTSTEWIITDILGDGRFKAVPKQGVKNWRVKNNIAQLQNIYGDWVDMKGGETFDLTGKSNPQYRRYQDWGKFLKNKYGGKEVTDPQGNSWIEIDLEPKYKKMPIEAFGLIGAVGAGTIFSKLKKD